MRSAGPTGSLRSNVSFSSGRSSKYNTTNDFDPIVYAIKKRKLETLRRLVENTSTKKLNAEFYLSDNVGEYMTYIGYAVYLRQKKAVKLLLDYHNKEGSTLLNRRSLLSIAVSNGDTSMMHILANHPSVNVNTKDVMGQTVLMQVIKPGYVPFGTNRVSLIRYLLNKGANPNIVDVYKFSPLMELLISRISHSNVDGDALRILLRAGADLNVKLPEIDSEHKHEYMKKSLVKGMNPLHLVMANHDPYNYVSAMVSYDISKIINGKDELGNTPLMFAAQKRHDARTIQLLIQKGAKTTLKNKNGETAYDIYNKHNASNKDQEVVELLSLGLKRRG